MKKISIILLNGSNKNIISNQSLSEVEVISIGGKIKNINDAIKSAKGKYIMFLKENTTIMDNILDKLYDTMENDNLDSLLFDSNVYKRTHEYEICDGQTMFSQMINNKEYNPSIYLCITKLSFLKENNIIVDENNLDKYVFDICLYSSFVGHLNEPVIELNEDKELTNIDESYNRFKLFISCLKELNGSVNKEHFWPYYDYFNDLYESSSEYLLKVKYHYEIDNLRETLTPYEDLLFRLIVEKHRNGIRRNRELTSSLKKIKKTKYIIHTILNKIRCKLKNTFHISPKISIIIPVYNVEAYLRECLDSLLKQSLKNIEIICVDDESTDSSYEILEEYRKKDKRIKIYKKKHSNAGDARNIGLSHAKGEYLLFLDSDDYFDKDLCKIAYNKSIKNKADIVLYDAYKYDQVTKKVGALNYLLKPYYFKYNEVYSSEALKDYIFNITNACPWSKIYRRKFVKENGLKFQSLENSNDVYFVRTCLCSAKRIVTIPNRLVYYRVHHGTNLQSNKHKNPLNFLKAYIEVKKFMDNKKIYEKFKVSYINVLLNEIAYNYDSTPSSQKEISSALKEYGVKELGLLNIDENIIYNKKDYKKYLDIIK